MKLRTIRPFDHPGALLVVFAVLLCVAGCVISPRRVVVTPSPTPTPDISPTPTPTLTPTPTPSGVDKTIPKLTGEFLFLGDAESPLLTGFRVNPDGSLAPLPGSPFPISAPARGLKAVKNILLVESENGFSFYRVENETGFLQPENPATATFLASGFPVNPQTAVLDADGRFMYVAEPGRAELAAYRIEKGTPVLVARYPVSRATALVLVEP